MGSWVTCDIGPGWAVSHLVEWRIPNERLCWFISLVRITSVYLLTYQDNISDLD